MNPTKTRSTAPALPTPQRPHVVEPAGSATKPKMYINSVAVTERGTWLVSFTRADEYLADGRFVPERVFLRRSEDRGQTWQDRTLVYDGQDRRARQAEMGQLLVVPHTNRVYQFSIRHTGVRFGQMVFTVSDDDGRTWCGPDGPNSAFDVPVPGYELTPRGDSNHFMARGIIMDNGEFILPLAIATDPPALADIEAEVVFLVSDNIFCESDPRRIRFRFLPEGRHGLRAPRPEDTTRSLAHEPHVVQLHGGRLMCTMRTGAGCIYYSVSDDFGRNWRTPQPLCYAEGQARILHPNAPCPFIRLRDGRFLLLHHNNDGAVFGSRDVYDFRRNRRPVYLCVGRELPYAAGQPMIFTASRWLQDSDGVPAGQMGTTELSCYSGIIEDERGVFFIYGNKWSQIEMLRIPPELLDAACLS